VIGYRSQSAMVGATTVTVWFALRKLRPTNNFQFWAIAIASSASGHVKGPTPETC
jgi:hypothetical protein